MIVGMLIPSNDPELFKSVMSLFESTLLSLMFPRKTGNAGQSPFVLVFNRAGVKSPCMLHCVAQSSNSFFSSSAPHRECSGPDERLLIGERHAVLGLEIAVCTRCTRTGPGIYYDSLSQWLALRCYHDRRTPITRTYRCLALNLFFSGRLLVSCLPER